MFLIGEETKVLPMISVKENIIHPRDSKYLGRNNKYEASIILI